MRGRVLAPLLLVASVTGQALIDRWNWARFQRRDTPTVACVNDSVTRNCDGAGHCCDLPHLCGFDLRAAAWFCVETFEGCPR